LDLETITEDRRRLQRRWSAEGYLPDRTLSQALAEGLAAHGELRSIYYSSREPRVTTNRELYEDGRRLAGALHGLGLAPGDVVAVQLPTWYETAVLYQAIFHVGATALPIVHVYGPSEVGFILRQSRARALVLPHRWRDADFLARTPLFGALPDLEHVVVVGEDVADDRLSFGRLLRAGSPRFEPAQTDPNDVCLLLYTSGTTSAPKGVRHTHNTLLWEWGRPTYAMQGLYLSCLPAGHYSGFGFLMRPSIYGAPGLFMDHWDAAFAAELVERHRVRHSGGTPIFLLTLLRVAEERAIARA
jgi:acyl-coenzyme A synthetase/AMP-(fatty) acid ligase